MSTTDNSEHQQHAFNEFDDAFVKRRENSMPTDEVIKAESLSADKEDKSKGYKAKKMDRDLTALSANYLNSISIESKISPRVIVNPGRIMVVWRDTLGLSNADSKTDEVLEISMNTIKFHCLGSEPAAVSQLIFPLTGKTLDIVQAILQSYNGETAVFRLVEFANNGEDWMTWIEKISRINEEL